MMALASETAIELLEALLLYDEHRRLSSSAALRHRWIAASGSFVPPTALLFSLPLASSFSTTTGAGAHAGGAATKPSGGPWSGAAASDVTFPHALCLRDPPPPEGDGATRAVVVERARVLLRGAGGGT